LKVQLEAELEGVLRVLLGAELVLVLDLEEGVEEQTLVVALVRFG
jgi:hypothetical protein